VLNKFFAKPIEIEIGEQTLKFCSLADFEFALAGRTSVPSKKITGMVKFSIDELKKEAHTIKEIEKRFVGILSKSIEEPGSINRSMRELDPLIFSQDHSWRNIITALHEGDEELDEFRRVALVKYMQYLSSRQEIIKYLYSEKKKYQKGKAVVENGDSAGSSFKDTLVLENTIFQPVGGGKEGSHLERMPKGEVVTLSLKQGEQIDLVLSRHECKLKGGKPVKFIDQAGREYELMKGKNVVGRDAASTIMMEPSLRDVSRLHLVIEIDNEDRINLTDLSSHGVFIDAQYLEQNTF